MRELRVCTFPTDALPSATHAPSERHPPAEVKPEHSRGSSVVGTGWKSWPNTADESNTEQAGGAPNEKSVSGAEARAKGKRQKTKKSLKRPTAKCWAEKAREQIGTCLWRLAIHCKEYVKLGSTELVGDNTHW
eukprot:gb/GEZN01003104.1/.p2 GENE.gb/GEZN01003104.1/~~gb/GEZN01003104.1/.p2  ORF type:complete len:133 (-),score=13.74 gb/GEZN01003104.1/:723-1121(-)